MIEPTVSAQFVKRVLTAASRAGAAPDVLCRSAGIAPLSSLRTEDRVPVSRYRRLWACAMEATRRPSLPIDVARVPFDDPGNVLAFACLTSRNLAEGIGRASRFLRVFSDVSRYALTPGANESRLVFETSGFHGHDPGPANLFALACIVQGGRSFTGVEWKPVAVRIAAPQPADARTIDEFFGVKVAFDAATTELKFARETLELPMRAAHPGLSAFFERQVETLLASEAAGDDIVMRTSQTITSSLADGVPSLADVAKQLGMSARTLRRRLAERDTRFQSILDQVRCSLAQRLLRENRLTLGEIAFSTGFSDVTAFVRSYRRWTGTTPNQHRAALAADHPSS